MASENERLEQIKIASLDIQHVDLIAEKKKKGVYSQWRKNILDTCECHGMGCDCNQASKNITLDPAPKQHRRSISSVSKGEAASKQEEDAIIIANTPERNSIDVPIEVCAPDVSTKQTIKKKCLDFANSTKEATADREVTISNAEPQSDIEFITLFQEMPNVDIPSLVTETSENELDKDVSQTESTPVLLRTPRRSILLSEENRQQERSFHSRSRKSLSVMLRCTCSYEKCDCKGVIKLPEKSAPSIEDIAIPKLPKPETSLRRVNSLELIKRRMSSVPVLPDTDEDSVKIGSSKSESSSVRIKSVDSLEIMKRRLSKTHKEDDEEEELVPSRTRAQSITFKI